MDWVGIPSKLPKNPTLLMLGPETTLAMIDLWCYANDHETDGFLPSTIVSRAFHLDVIGKLLKAGLLEAQSEHFYLPGFLDCNLTHEAREARRNACAAAGKASGASRRSARTSRSTSRSTPRSTSRRTPGPGPIPIQEPEPEEEVSPPSPPSAQPRQTTIEPDPAPEPRPTSAEAALVATPRGELVPAKKSAMTLKAVGGTGTDLISDCLKWIAEKPPRNGQERVWQFYVIRYCIAAGSKPTDKVYYHTNLEALVNQHTPEVVIGKINSYFDRPTWPYEKGARDLDRFVKYFDQIPATKDAAIVRQIGFERASAEFLGRVNGHADLIPPEILDLMRGPRKDTPF